MGMGISRHIRSRSMSIGKGSAGHDRVVTNAWVICHVDRVLQTLSEYFRHAQELELEARCHRDLAFSAVVWAAKLDDRSLEAGCLADAACISARQRTSYRRT